MSNTYCAATEQESYNLTTRDKLIMGGYVFLLLGITVIVLYQVSMGIYIDPESLT